MMDTHQMAKAAGISPETPSVTEESVPTQPKPRQKTRKGSAANSEIKSRRQVAAEFVDLYYADISSCFQYDVPSAKSFVRSCCLAIASDPDLIRATSEAPSYLAGAMLQAAMMHLEPNTPLGLCFLCPYRHKSRNGSSELRVSFQLGYQGAIQLHRQSGEQTYVNAEPVYEKDFFDYELGGSPFIRHKPCMDDDRGDIVRYYAVVKERNAEFPLFKVWTKSRVVSHARQFSRMWDAASETFSGAWATNFDSMAMKTVLLDCLRFAPKSAHFALAISTDNTSKPYDAQNDEVDELLDKSGTDFEDSANDDTALIDCTGRTPGEVSDIIKKTFGLKSGSEL